VPFPPLDSDLHVGLAVGLSSVGLVVGDAVGLVVGGDAVVLLIVGDSVGRSDGASVGHVLQLIRQFAAASGYARHHLQGTFDIRCSWYTIYPLARFRCCVDASYRETAWVIHLDMMLVQGRQLETQ